MFKGFKILGLVGGSCEVKSGDFVSGAKPIITTHMGSSLH